MQDVVTAILGGGQGTRLYPLTQERSKPAVPLAGRFRLIDIPISNSLHAGITRIYVMTQFNSHSLHRHISNTYRFDHFGRGYVDLLAAEQSADNRDWYQGTADAVRQNLPHLLDAGPRDVLVLSGDQLYLMEISEFVSQHRRLEADLTIAVKAVPRSQARGLGIMRVDGDGRIVEFVEKPTEDAQLDDLALDGETLARLGFDAPSGHLLASMGIYTFRAGVLEELLEGDEKDFGKEVIPGAIHDRRVFAFAHNGYWEDIGTIRSFHQASLALTLPLPPLNLYSRDFPIYTHPRFLPGAKINRCHMEHTIVCEGAIIEDSRITNSIIGIRSMVRPGTVIEDSIMMGARYFEQRAPRSTAPVGVGRDCVIRNAILDLDASIGDGCRLVNTDNVEEADADNFCIRDGLIVVPRGADIPAGTVV